MTLAHAAQSLKNCGQPPLADWPWMRDLGVGTEPPPAAVGTPPWERANVVEIQLLHDGEEQIVEDALASGFPVVLLLEVTDEFNGAAIDGSIDVPDIRSPMGNYHAVLAVGAYNNPQWRRRLLIRNSWGPGWGAGGYGWLPLDYLIANVVQAAVVM